MLYLLNHEILISVLVIQDGIFLYFLYFTRAKRNFQLKEAKQRFFVQLGSQQHGEDLVEKLSQGEGRLGMMLFGWVSPELHMTSKHSSTAAPLSSSSEFAHRCQSVRTITPLCFLLGVAEKAMVWLGVAMQAPAQEL